MPRQQKHRFPKGNHLKDDCNVNYTTKRISLQMVLFMRCDILWNGSRKTGGESPPKLERMLKMVTRTLSAEAYESLRSDLLKKAHIEPMEVGYTVDMRISGVDYTVKLVLDKHKQVAVLQANRIDRHRSGMGDQLITGGAVLTAFLEILVYQGVR